MQKESISERENGIVDKLLAYKEKDSMTSNVTYAFTNIKEAEDLVKSNWLAFLFAVIFDQQIPSEKAWAIPLKLKRRIGHLDIQKIAEINDQELIRIFREPEPLHRYVNKMALWIKSACKKIISKYNGKVENIWSDTKQAKDIINRLDDFDGIGQKKSTMATNFLMDYFKIPIIGWESIDISVDVMIRRVFKKLQLVVNDASDEDIIMKARALRPSFPGELDYPCWAIGRYWCLPKNPYCYYKKNGKEDNCPLLKECLSVNRSLYGAKRRQAA